MRTINEKKEFLKGLFKGSRSIYELLPKSSVIVLSKDKVARIPEYVETIVILPENGRESTV